MHNLTFVSPAAADRRLRVFLPHLLMALLAVSLVASQKNLDAIRASVVDQFGVGLTVHGFTRFRGWTNHSLLAMTAALKDVSHLGRFIAKVRDA